MKNHLITVPTFTYQQGKHFDDSFKENPIQVSFYNGSIELSQEGGSDENKTVLIHPDHFEPLFKAIKKNMPEALNWLESH